MSKPLISDEELQQPLSETELDELDEFLATGPRAEVALPLGILDGFLTAVTSGPVRMRVDEWLPEVWDGAPFDTPEQEKRMTRLVLRHMNDIDCWLAEEPESYAPMLQESGKGQWAMLEGDAWSYGYLLGMELNREAWAPAFEDEGMAAALEPIFLLGTEELDAAQQALVKTATQRHELAKKLGESAVALHQYWLPHRPPAVVTLRREEPKVGRNDPCPCGSGRKYKKCCADEKGD